MSGHSHFFGSLNFHPRLFRIAQFGKEFGAYIFLGEYFILISLNILSNFIPKCSRLFILRYDLVGTSTSWCGTEISEHLHHWENRSAHPIKTVKYGLTSQHQPKSFLGTCELHPFSPQNWPQIVRIQSSAVCVLLGSTSIKRAVLCSFLRETQISHSLVNH